MASSPSLVAFVVLIMGGCGSSEPARRRHHAPRESAPESSPVSSTAPAEPLEPHGELIPATDMSSLLGRRFALSTAQGFEPASYGKILLSFGADGSTGFYAGCNSFGGQASLLDGRLVSWLGGTEMGCFGDIGGQEDWMLRFLRAKPRVMLEGDLWIRLVGDDATLVFFEIGREAPALPDAPVIGTSWTITDLHRDQRESIHTENASMLAFHDDGSLRVDTTCSAGTGRWAYGLDDRELTLTTVTYSAAACGDSNALLDSHIRELISDGTINVAFGSGVLFLTRGGIGITAVAR